MKNNYSAHFMNEAAVTKDDLRLEYDFRKLGNPVTGKYAEAYNQGSNLVFLDEDVARGKTRPRRLKLGPNSTIFLTEIVSLLKTSVNLSRFGTAIT